MHRYFKHDFFGLADVFIVKIISGVIQQSKRSVLVFFDKGQVLVNLLLVIKVHSLELNIWLLSVSSLSFSLHVFHIWSKVDYSICALSIEFDSRLVQFADPLVVVVFDHVEVYWDNSISSDSFKAHEVLK